MIVDETSMVSLSLMAKLVEAVRPDARLILVGDPDQLASVEAGAVLGDIVGPAVAGCACAAPARAALAAVAGEPVAAEEPPPGVAVGDGIVVLDRVHRYGGDIAAPRRRHARRRRRRRCGPARRDTRRRGALAPGRRRERRRRAISRRCASWPSPPAPPSARRPRGATRRPRWTPRRASASCARTGAARTASRTWMAQVERWLAGAVPDFAAEGPWYVGRPLLVTENDYALRLYNGDTGVVVQTEPGRVAAAFDRGGDVLAFAPARLGAVDTVYAMTVHKTQGSQFDDVGDPAPRPDVADPCRGSCSTRRSRARRSASC